MVTLVPSLNRVKLLGRFLQSAIDCETSTNGVIIIDKEDWNKNRNQYEELKKPDDWEFYVSKAVKMGDKIREVFPTIENHYTAVNILNDDHVIKTKNWDKRLFSKIDGTNFVTCNDAWMSPAKAAGATVFSMDLLKTVGFPIYPHGMIHLFIDDLWESIGRGTGIWDIDQSVLIEHHNQLRTPETRDKTFYDVYGRGPDLHNAELWKNDEKVYQEFMRNDYMLVRNKIRKLRGQIEIIYQS